MRVHGPEGSSHSSTEDGSIEEELTRFESRWRAGDRGSIEHSLAGTDPTHIPDVLARLIEAEIHLRREVGERPSPGEYHERFPEHAEAIDAVFENLGDAEDRKGRDEPSDERSTEEFPQVDDHAPTLTEQDPTEPLLGWNNAGPSPRDGCRYRILSFHDGGGLGKIYVAEDLELKRKVALKEIREQLASDPQARARFLLEAEVIGKLEHPGIVPIYGMGHYADGRPYYAMRFIKGDSLRKAIETLHKGQAGRSPGEHELMFRGLLGRIVDACNAIEYAHSRNVLHRDIKPSNIMLGRFGETLVVDWGLTKVLDSDYEEKAEVEDFEASEGPFHSQASEEVDPTRVDSPLGTLRYSSPEQAAGKIDQIGRASDIFCLGATLYCLLTGRPPFTGEDRKEIEEKARRCEFLPARKVRRDVPAPLESICSKAMRLDPGDRYPSARELADDIERWLADEPVSAHKDSATTKLARWVRRHRPQVASAAALLITLSVGLAYSNVVIRAKERRAEANFQLASDAVDQFLVRVSDKSLRYVPQMNQLRSDLGDDAARFHKKLLEQHPDDPSLRWNYAETCRAAANNHILAGRFDRFFEYYEEIIATYRFLIDHDPDNRRYVNAIIYAEIQKASALQKSGQIKPAIALLGETLKEAERLAGEDPTSNDFRQTYALARVRACLCDALVMVGRLDEARGHYESAIERLAPVVGARPKNHKYRRDLIWLFCGRGIVASEAGDEAEAKRAFEAAEEHLGRLKEQGDTPVEVDSLRAYVLNEKGCWLASVSRSSEAERAHEQALQLMDGLLEKYPDLTDYQLEGASALLNRGLVRAGLAQQQAKHDAEQDLERAIALLDPIVLTHPEMARARSMLGRAKGALGRLLLDRGDGPRATSLLNRAVELQKRCLDENETSPVDGKALREHEDWLRRAKAVPST